VVQGCHGLQIRLQALEASAFTAHGIIESRRMKYIPLMAFVVLFSSSAAAEDCRIYPPGRTRSACASAQHPGLVARREHCKQEAQSMSVNSRRGTQGLAFRDYVISCMQREH
jgi:hypothetical protein